MFAGGSGRRAHQRVSRPAKRRPAASTISLSTVPLAIGRLGLQIGELEGLGTDALFERMARAAASVEDPGRRVALPQRVFSRGTADTAAERGSLTSYFFVVRYAHRSRS